MDPPTSVAGRARPRPLAWFSHLCISAELTGSVASTGRRTQAGLDSPATFCLSC